VQSTSRFTFDTNSGCISACWAHVRCMRPCGIGWKDSLPSWTSFTTYYI